MNIIYLTTTYEVGDGTSTAIKNQIECDKHVCDSYLLLAKKIPSYEEDLNVGVISNITLIKDFLRRKNIHIHYFKSRSSNVLMDLLEMSGYGIPVITTVCQSPSYPNLWITPFELKHTWHFVFIDKASYNNKLVGFIPDKLKSQIYLSAAKYRDYSSVKKTDNGGKIVFGRGSSSVKCPRNMFEVFDKINVPNKLFRIVGIDGSDNWIYEEARKRNNVEVYGKLSPEEWVEMCNSFDVFLYQLPDDCFSSLDGTLGLAMLLGKPVVYMGCPAPKERFHNNENGFVAESVDEMVEFATKLGNDAELRFNVGEKGRISTLTDFKGETRVKEYRRVYYTTKKHSKFRIPLRYWLLFLTKNFSQSKQYIRGILRINFKSIFWLYSKLK